MFLSVLENKAPIPIAVLAPPVELTFKALRPIAVLDVPVVLLIKALFPAAKLFPPVAEELKFVVAPIEIFVETFPPPLLKNTPLIEPVTPKEPEMFTVFASKITFYSMVYRNLRIYIIYHFLQCLS
jgi:hypothetical protein